MQFSGPCVVAKGQAGSMLFILMHPSARTPALPPADRSMPLGSPGLQVCASDSSEIGRRHRAQPNDATCPAAFPAVANALLEDGAMMHVSQASVVQDDFEETESPLSWQPRNHQMNASLQVQGQNGTLHACPSLTRSCTWPRTSFV
jgi:hypothetical protein